MLDEEHVLVKSTCLPFWTKCRMRTTFLCMISQVLRKKMQAGGGLPWLFAAATMFAFTSLLVKAASAYVPGLLVSAVRFAIGVLLCTAAILVRKSRLDPSMRGIVALRGLAGSLSMAATYVAIGMTGPGRATLLSNTYPVFVSLFGALLFKEKITWRTLASLAVCTLGAVLVFRDGSGASPAGDLFALAGSLLAGIAVNFVRKASRAGVDPFMLYLSPSLFGLALFLWAPLPQGGIPATGLLLVVAVGIGAFLAQAFMAYGYRTVPASKGSIVFYWETALTVLLGVLFAGEVLMPRFLAGLGCIAAGLWINMMPSAPNRPGEPAPAGRQ